MRTEIMIAILCMAAVTYLTRFGSFALLGSTGIAPWIDRLLKHVPVAILSALIAPALLAPKGFVEVTPGNHYLLAGAVAAYMAYRRQPPFITMGMGIGVMLALRYAGN